MFFYYQHGVYIRIPFTTSYNKQPGTPDYNDCCDFDDDFIVNLSDLAIFGAHYLHQCPREAGTETLRNGRRTLCPSIQNWPTPYLQVIHARTDSSHRG